MMDTHFLVKVNIPELFDLGPGMWHRLLNHGTHILRDLYPTHEALLERLKEWVFKDINIENEEIKRRAKSLMEWSGHYSVAVVNKYYAIHDYRLLDVPYCELRKFIGIHHNQLYRVTGGFSTKERKVQNDG